MVKTTRIPALVLLAATCLLAACQTSEQRDPPPDARRPVLRSEAELAAEREERVTRGEVVPAPSPKIEVEPARPLPTAPPRPLEPGPDAIEADILMVNNAVLTVADVLYPIRDELLEMRDTLTATGFRERARQAIRSETQRQVGSLLIYAEAIDRIAEERRGALNKAVEQEVDNFTARAFGGSTARLNAHLAQWGLTREQFLMQVRRDIVVRQYTREKLRPQIQIRRDELWSAYQRQIDEYRTPETRELLLIELPFAAFLPDDVTWRNAAPMAKAAAKVAAAREARQAYEALAEQPFANVARAYSRGINADKGGSWGMIGRPLQPPLDEASALIFEYQEGQYSEPIETEEGWCIVQCGAITPADERSFVEVQDELRQELMERRFARLSTDYIMRLAEDATISSLDLFLSAALKKAMLLTEDAGQP